jgi:hypothetical protein
MIGGDDFLLSLRFNYEMSSMKVIDGGKEGDGPTPRRQLR